MMKTGAGREDRGENVPTIPTSSGQDRAFGGEGHARKERTMKGFVTTGGTGCAVVSHAILPAGTLSSGEGRRLDLIHWLQLKPVA
jgi:hypothetical protein